MKRSFIILSLFIVNIVFASTVEEFMAKAEIGTFKGYNEKPITYMKVINDNEVGAIVFSQGYTEHYAKWIDTMQFFYDLGYSVYTWDHRGQGLSGRFGAEDDIVHVDSFMDYVWDMKKFVRLIVKAQKHDKTLLFSHSMGGAIAAEFLIQYKNDFDGAIFASPMLEPRAPGMTIEEALQTAEYYCSIGYCTVADPSQAPFDPTQDPVEAFMGAGTTHDAERFIKYFYYRVQNPDAVTSRASMGWVKEAVYSGRRSLALASQIKIPILILQAGADFYVNTAKQNEFCAKVPNCTLIPFAMELPGLPAPYNMPFHELYNEVAPVRNAVLGMSADFYSHF